MNDFLPFAIALAVGVGVVAAVAKAIGWLVSKAVPDMDDAQTGVGCAVLFGIALLLGLLFGLVKFVKWAWEF